MNMNCFWYCFPGLWRYSDSADIRFRIQVCLCTGSFLKWKLLEQAKRIRGKIPQILSFASRLEKELAGSSREKGIPPETYEMMYRQKAFQTCSDEYIRLEYRLGNCWEMIILRQDRNLTIYWIIQKGQAAW